MNRAERLKPDICTVLADHGVELKRKGRRLWGCCPIHSEKTPSFAVDEDKQRFRCFGCGVSGDVIELVMTLHGLSFHEALQRLGIDRGKPYGPDPREQRKRELLRAFETWAVSYHAELCDYLLYLQKVKKAMIKTIEQAEAFVEYYHEESTLDYHVSILAGNDRAAQLRLYREILNEN